MSRQVPDKTPAPEEQQKRDELRGFLFEAAGLAVEAAKPSDPEEPPPPPPPPVAQAAVVTTEPTMRRGILVALLASLATIAVVFFWPTPKGVPVPEAMVGEWVTASPKYPGRVLWISAIDVGFQTAGNMPLHPIRSVSIRPMQEGAERVIIDYETGSGPYTLDVTRSGDRLAFTNQADVVWTRLVRP
jgi:hypothetical protein